MSEVTRTLRIYEQLLDESTEIAVEHGMTFPVYAGYSARLLNQLNGYHLEPRATELVVDTRRLQIPPLSTFINTREDLQQDYVDIQFPSQQDLDTFEASSKDCEISVHERMNRALRLGNFILINLETWQNPVLTHKGERIEDLKLG